MPFARYLPAAQWLRSYRRSDLPGDLLAAGSVTIMLIPQSLLPLIAYAAFGSSRTLAVGNTRRRLCFWRCCPGSSWRPGFLANLLSHPVISGFISASAIVTALSQLKHVLGIEASGDNLVSLLGGIASRARNANWTTIASQARRCRWPLWPSPPRRASAKAGFPDKRSGRVFLSTHAAMEALSVKEDRS